MDLVTMIMACSLYRDNSIVNAIVETGSKNNPLQVTTLLEDGSKTITTAANPAAGAAYVNQQLQQGRDVYIGLMQIPSGWLEKYKDQASISELFRPCKNMVIATTVLNHAAEICAKQLNRDPRCDLAIYRTGRDSEAGQAYADTILAYAAVHKVKPTPQFENVPQEELPSAVLPKQIELPEPQFNSTDTP